MAYVESAQWPAGFDKGNRYEGLLDVPRSAPPFVVLSFLVGPRPSVGQWPVVRARFYAPEAARIVVSARELVEQTQYRMESKPFRAQIGWNEFAWPVADVIQPGKVDLEKLGIVVSLVDMQDSARLLPATVFQSKTTPSSQSYTLVLRSRYTLKSVSYSVWHDSTRAAVPIRNETFRRTYPGEESFEIVIDAKGLPVDWLRVVVEGEYAFQTGGPQSGYRFFNRTQQ